MQTLLPLKKMSRVATLREMEALWTDLSANEGAVNSPAWHAAALRKAEQAVEAGTAKFSDWDEAKQWLRRKAAKVA